MPLFSGPLAFGITIESDYPVVLYNPTNGIYREYRSAQEAIIQQGIFYGIAQISGKPLPSIDAIQWNNEGGWSSVINYQHGAAFIRDPLLALACWLESPDDKHIEPHIQKGTGIDGYIIHEEFVHRDDNAVIVSRDDTAYVNYQVNYTMMILLKKQALDSIESALMAQSTGELSAVIATALHELNHERATDSYWFKTMNTPKEALPRRLSDALAKRTDGFVIARISVRNRTITDILILRNLVWKWLQAESSTLFVPGCDDELACHLMGQIEDATNPLFDQSSILPELKDRPQPHDLLFSDRGSAQRVIDALHLTRSSSTWAVILPHAASRVDEALVLEPLTDAVVVSESPSLVKTEL